MAGDHQPNVTIQNGSVLWGFYTKLELICGSRSFVCVYVNLVGSYLQVFVNNGDCLIDLLGFTCGFKALLF